MSRGPRENQEMKRLHQTGNVQILPYADLSYWQETPAGVRLATLGSASFALLGVPARLGEPSAAPGARFALPDELPQMLTALNALEHVCALGRAHHARDIARALGVSITGEPLAFPVSRSAHEF